MPYLMSDLVVVGFVGFWGVFILSVEVWWRGGGVVYSGVCGGSGYTVES